MIGSLLRESGRAEKIRMPIDSRAPDRRGDLETAGAVVLHRRRGDRRRSDRPVGLLPAPLRATRPRRRTLRVRPDRA